MRNLNLSFQFSYQGDWAAAYLSLYLISTEWAHCCTFIYYKKFYQGIWTEADCTFILIVSFSGKYSCFLFYTGIALSCVAWSRLWFVWIRASGWEVDLLFGGRCRDSAFGIFQFAFAIQFQRFFPRSGSWQASDQMKLIFVFLGFCLFESSLVAAQSLSCPPSLFLFPESVPLAASKLSFGTLQILSGSL